MRSGSAGISSETEKLSYATGTSKFTRVVRETSTKPLARAAPSGRDDEAAAQPRRAGALVARHDPDRDLAVGGQVGGLGRGPLAVQVDLAALGREDDRQVGRSLDGLERAGRCEE